MLYPTRMVDVEPAFEALLGETGENATEMDFITTQLCGAPPVGNIGISPGTIGEPLGPKLPQ